MHLQVVMLTMLISIFSFSVNAGSYSQQFGKANSVGDFNNDSYADYVVASYEVNETDNLLIPRLDIKYGDSDYSAYPESGETQRIELIEGEIPAEEAYYDGINDLLDPYQLALIVGNFNGDLYQDLIVGAPNTIVPTLGWSGAVYVYKGSEKGLRDSPQIVYSPMLGVGDLYGYALAAADFNGDSYADLAVGLPGTTGTEDIPERGGVDVLYGSPQGLARKNSGIYLSSASLLGAAMTANTFGEGDLCADLVVGAPDTTVNGQSYGLSYLIKGTSTGLSTSDIQTIDQTYIDGGENNSGDAFGLSMASADFNKDGYMDIVIGVPYKNNEEIMNAGAVAVLYGYSGGFQKNQGNTGILHHGFVE